MAVTVERIKLLLNNPNLSDIEVEIIRDELQAISKVIFRKWLHERNLSKGKLLETINQN